MGQIFLHDVREAPLQEAKKRFARSGINNVQYHCGEKTLKKYIGKMNWVVLDVPCSGKGDLTQSRHRHDSQESGHQMEVLGSVTREFDSYAAR